MAIISERYIENMVQRDVEIRYIALWATHISYESFKRIKWTDHYLIKRSCICVYKYVYLYAIKQDIYNKKDM